MAASQRSAYVIGEVVSLIRDCRRMRRKVALGEARAVNMSSALFDGNMEIPQWRMRAI
jgi:hypothetical protein